MQACTHSRSLSEIEPPNPLFRSVKQDYYPEHLRRSKWSSFLDFKSPSLEQRLANSHRARDQEFRSQRAAELDDEGWRIGLCRVYLDFCRKLPFYGYCFSENLSQASRWLLVSMSKCDLTVLCVRQAEQKPHFFRAAFFKGQIEHPGSSRFRLRTINDDPVYVAINTEGVSVIDMDDVVKFCQVTRSCISVW